jgi:hypothetical protein
VVLEFELRALHLLGRQVLYSFSHTLVCFRYFSCEFLSLCPELTLDCDPPTASFVAEITDVCYHAQHGLILLGFFFFLLYVERKGIIILCVYVKG